MVILKRSKQLQTQIHSASNNPLFKNDLKLLKYTPVVSIYKLNTFQSRKTVGNNSRMYYQSYKCNVKRCSCCRQINLNSNIKSTTNGRIFNAVLHNNVDWKTKDVIYVITWNEPKCCMQYVGQTSRPLKTRFREHKYNSNNKKSKVKTYLYSHFRRTGHNFQNANIQIVENISFDAKTNNSNKNKTRYTAELQWIKRLQTPFPLGLNDNVYQVGNISKDTGIDIFSLFSSRRRKTRSHGRRRNRNIKRKNRKDVSNLVHTVCYQCLHQPRLVNYVY